MSDKEQQSETSVTPRHPGLLGRIRTGLSRTRDGLTEGLGHLVLGKKRIDDEVLEELETRLLLADVGIEPTAAIIDDLTQRVARRQLNDVEALFGTLKDAIVKILEPCSQILQIRDDHKPFVILMVGVNGAGKTTTIGKMAKHFQTGGKSVMLAAADTFRAAAVEQLQVWGHRNAVPVIAPLNAKDPAAVVFDAMQAAAARHIDVLIVDTAGRLHTQVNLLEELKKIKRVIARIDASAPHEVMLVVDAGTGQNALHQARQFNEAVSLSGITLTKLDGTAKGGIVLAIAASLKIPIRYIGVGEAIDDLRPFDAHDFAAALLD